MNKIPNLLTIIRILSVPFLVFTILSSSNFYNIIAVFLFISISITDYLDGFLARKMKVETKFGEMLDPIADKILIICVLIALLINQTINGLSIIPAYLIISREIFISGLREFYSSNSSSKLKVSYLGKIKTAIQMLSLIILISSQIIELNNLYIISIGILLLWISMIFTVVSGYQYYKKIFS